MAKRYFKQPKNKLKMCKRKRIKRNLKEHNKKMMELSRKIHEKRKELNRKEEFFFNVKLSFKHPDIFARN